MSRYEWESGTVLLPRVAVKPMRDRLNKTLNDRRNSIWISAKRINSQLRTQRVKAADEWDAEALLQRVIDGQQLRPEGRSLDRNVTFREEL